MSPERTETLRVSGPPSVELQLAAGSARVVLGEPGAVTVAVRGPDVETFRIQQAGDRVSLRPEEGLGRHWRHYQLTVTVPAGADLQARVASADVTVEAPLARLRASLASGDLRAGDV